MILVGMGIENLSMSSKQICTIKELLASYTSEELTEYYKDALKESLTF
jgi:phosphoenolpyruvate-protein kinase (PTS system EI component)